VVAAQGDAAGLAVDFDVERDAHGRRVNRGRNDPCDRVPPGRSPRCPERGGSSSGVTKGDFNGDTIGDLAIGVPLEDIGTAEDAGAVNVIYGSPLGLTPGGAGTGVPLNQFVHQNQPGIPGSAERGDQFGRALASGNFDGDAYSDLAIGIPFEDTDSNAAVDAGLVLIVFGSANGLDFNRTQEINPQSAREQFGFSLAWGDFDEDGVGDLAIGAPNRSVPASNGNVRGGGVSVRYGVAGAGLGSREDRFRQNRELQLPVAFGEVGDGARENDRFGETMAAGDFDNDGTSDLVVGVPGNDDFDGDFLNPSSFIANSGGVHIIFGDGDGLGRRGDLDGGADDEHHPFWFLSQRSFQIGEESTPTDPIPGAAEAGDWWGHAVAIGRRSGSDHLYIGIPGEDFNGASNAGGVLELRGMGSWRTIAARFWSQESAGIQGATEDNDMFGFSLAAADFNADGRPDLAIGVPFEALEVDGRTVQAAGAVNVIYGSDDGLNEANDQLWRQGLADFGTGQPERLDRFGYALTAWDFGNGSAADLAIGVPGEELFTLADCGMVHVLYGSPARLSVLANQFWHQDRPGILDSVEADDQFGFSAY
jgi:hypothetical protein